MKVLSRRIVEKPWGKDILPPPFAGETGRRIGEIWYEPPPEMRDVLVKYIFTSEKLSVQVHPSDDQARALGESDRGKEECWLVLDAEPGALLGLGFAQALSTEQLRSAALDGSIETLMAWHPVSRGDFFYIPAGTVHAIGAGITLVEVQQNSDITYRLYDYGRPRELHLAKGLAVVTSSACALGARRMDLSTFRGALVDGTYFAMDVVDQRSFSAKPEVDTDFLLVVLDSETGEAGDCLFVSAGENIEALGRFTGLRVTLPRRDLNHGT